MDIVLHFRAGFEAAFLVNGAFFERADIRGADDSVLFLTVLPLDAVLLPYTVKFIGARALTNESLCTVYELGEGSGHYYVGLAKRYNYVYSTKRLKEPPSSGVAARFFSCVKDRNLAEARTLLTDELSRSIDNTALLGFFDGYTDIIENQGFVPAPPHSHFLIDQNGRGKLCSFELSNSLIDNIIELE